MAAIPYELQFKMCSEAFQASMEGLQREGIPYHDDRAFTAARLAIETFAPDTVKLTNERVLLGAELGVAVDVGEGKSRHFRELGTRAIFRRVQIQEVREQIEEEGISVEVVRHDLCALFTPAFTDPEPVDLVLYNQLYVPFGSFELFDPEGAS